MFNKFSINKCNRFMYLEYNKKDLKENVTFPKILDYFETKKVLIDLIGCSKECLDQVFTYDVFSTKIDLIYDKTYYMIKFVKNKINDDLLKKLSYDKKILEKNNVTIDKYMFVHINKNFKKNGDIDFNEFFIFDEVKEIPDFNLEDLKDIITNEQHDVYNLSCKKCPYIKYCVRDYCEYENSIFSLRGKIDDLLKEKIYDLKNININYLDESQRKQIENKVIIDKDYIRTFLKTIKKPINFIDFEKATLIIPVTDGKSSNESFFFQYSLDVYDQDIKHSDCIIDNYNDLKILATKLNEELKEGSVVCFNPTTEKEAIQTLYKMFPDLDNLKIDDSRYVDLSIIFTKMMYYNPKMLGSSSIKSVLPALTNISYESLNSRVENGLQAANSIIELKKLSGDDKQKLEEEMKNYCGLDTIAMYKIYFELLKIVH